MLILVAGVHAVGKTYLAEPVAKELGFRHATASQLIKAERGAQSWGSDKRVGEVDDNQVALIAAVARLRSKGEDLLLDGHFVLRDPLGNNIRLDVDVFRDLHLDGIVLLEAPVEVILERLEARRDYSWSKEAIASLVHDEGDHARTVSDVLNIPLRTLRSPSLVEFRAAIEAIAALSRDV